MALIYITGPSGAGKSTITPILVDHGYEAHDADVDLCSWYNSETMQKVEYPKLASDRLEGWEDNHIFLMDEALIKTLYARSRETTIFILGNCNNDIAMAKRYFDKVLCLYIDEEIMVKRILSRTTNQHGKDPDQLAIMRKWYKPVMDRYKNYGATMIDGAQQIKDIVERIIQETQ